MSETDSKTDRPWVEIQLDKDRYDLEKFSSVLQSNRLKTAILAQLSPGWEPPQSVVSMGMDVVCVMMPGVRTFYRFTPTFESLLDAYKKAAQS